MTGSLENWLTGRFMPAGQEEEMRYTKFWGLFLAVVFFVFPAVQSVSAKNVPKDVTYLLGLYYGNGSVFLVRENRGELELLYQTDPADKDFSHANIFPLKKVRFDSYTINEAGPLLSAEAAVHFERDADGNGILCKVGGKRFTRAFFPGQGNKTQRLEPNADAAALKSKAAQFTPPASLQKGKAAHLVNLRQAVPSALFDLRYATDNNIFGVPLYAEKVTAMLDEQAGKALQKAASSLETHGYGLLIWEAYRPWYISKLASDLLPAKQKGMLPLPKEGEDRNTGLAVDVSLYYLDSGLPVAMISDFDEISPRQFPAYAGGTEKQRQQRDLLVKSMQDSGFVQGEQEWWHFTLGDVAGFQHLNLPN